MPSQNREAGLAINDPRNEPCDRKIRCRMDRSGEQGGKWADPAK